VKCHRCGRGITYRRVARDAAFIRTRYVPGARREHWFCGLCFAALEGSELEASHWLICLGDEPGTERFLPFTIDEVA
jgi:hypothetical protein